MPVKLYFRLVLFILLINCHPCFSQTSSQRILGSFEFGKRSFNYEFVKVSSSEYTFKVSSVDAKMITTTAASEEDEATTDTNTAKDPDYKFASFSVEVFVPIFADQMLTVFNYPTDQKIREKGLELFYTIQTKLDFRDDEPVTAFLILRRDYINSYLQTNGSNYYRGRLSWLIAGHKVSEVSVEFDDGAIKNIKVKLVRPSVVRNFTESPTQYLEFKNQYPISISGKFDPEKLAEVNLYSYNCNGEKGVTRYIRLSDLLLFDIVLANNKEDYSPVNSTVLLKPESRIVELKKEKRSRIIDIAAFTDFTGLDQEEPNGLIQIEASRRLNLNTKYRLLFGNRKNEKILSRVDLKVVDVIVKDSASYKKDNQSITYHIYKKPPAGDSNWSPLKATALDSISIKNHRFRSPYVNFFGSVEPKLLFSKLEENNRFIDSGKVNDRKIDPVQLYQYQLACFGLKLNILKLSFPQLKLNWNVLYTGAYWFRTRLSTSSDSASKSSIPLNSHYLLFGTNFVFSPDSRWGVTVGCDYIRPQTWTKDYGLIRSNGLLQPYFDGHLKTNEESKLFFRFKWTHERLNRENNFTQIQLGYSLTLFAK